MDNQVKVGIENLKNLVNFAATGVEIGFAVTADGKVDLSDVGHIYRIVPLVGPLVQSFKQIPAEFANIDTAEAQELLQYISTRFVVTDAKAQIIINHSLKIAARCFDIYIEAAAMKRELDTLPGGVVQTLMAAGRSMGATAKANMAAAAVPAGAQGSNVIGNVNSPSPNPNAVNHMAPLTAAAPGAAPASTEV